MKASELQIGVVYMATAHEYQIKVVDLDTRYSKYGTNLRGRYMKDDKGKFFKCVRFVKHYSNPIGDWVEDYFMPQQIIMTWEQHLIEEHKRDLERIERHNREKEEAEFRHNVHMPAVEMLLSLLRKVNTSDKYIYESTKLHELPTSVVSTLIDALNQIVPPDTDEDEELDVVTIESVGATIDVDTADASIEERYIDRELIERAKAYQPKISALFRATVQMEVDSDMPTQLTKASFRGFHWEIVAHGRYVNVKIKYVEKDKKQGLIEHEYSYWFDSVEDAVYVVQYKFGMYHHSLTDKSN